jgi:hypothetical protein
MGINPQSYEFNKKVVDGHHLFIVSAELGHLNVMNRILEESWIDPTCYDFYAFRWSAINGHSHVLQQLVDCPDIKNCIPFDCILHLGATHGRLNIVQLMIHRPEISKHAKLGALFEAVKKTKIRVVDFLTNYFLETGDEILYNRKLLEIARTNNCRNLVDELLKCEKLAYIHDHSPCGTLFA